MFIYLIVNHVTGKYYVGQHKGTNLRKYLQRKFSEARHNHGSSYLFNSMRKHPLPCDWSIHALLSDIQTKSELDAHERDFITFLRSQDPEYGYNICRGGEGFTGPHTEQWREKVRESWAKKRARGYKHPPSPFAIDMTGMVVNEIEVLNKVAELDGCRKRARWFCRCHCGKTFTTLGASLRSGNTKSCGCLLQHLSEDHRRKLSDAANKLPLSQEHRRKISEALKGKTGRRHSLKSRLKMSEAAKGRSSWNKGEHHSPETILKISEAAKRRAA